MDYVPLNNLIVETSSPLGQARARAISKVETSWFAFIDDDAYITREWFHHLLQYVEPDVGAVQGFMWTLGVNRAWSKIYNIEKRPEKPFRLKAGERGKTHNTLIRTGLVEDWKPSIPDLSSWEDYEISQHILAKGYDWIVCPAPAYHVISPRKVWHSAIWKAEGWKKRFKPSPLTVSRKFLHHTLAIPRHCGKFLIGRESLGELGYWLPDHLITGLATLLK